MNTVIDFSEHSGSLRRPTVNVKSLQRAARSLRVEPLESEGRYLVASASHAGAHYLVTLEPGSLAGECTCPWAQHGGSNCKHVLAALRARYRSEGALSFWRSREAAARQHRPILQGPGFYATLRRAS